MTKLQVKGWHVLVFTNSILLAIFLFLIFVPGITSLDERLGDFWMEIRYEQTGPHFDRDLALIGIDDKSRNPTDSSFSDAWNSGGWRTRLNYVAQLAIFERIHPKVVSYDILFPPDGVGKRKERSPALEKIIRDLYFNDLTIANETVQQIESEGNQKMQAQFFRLDDARQEEIPAPNIALAYRFPDDKETRSRRKENQEGFEFAKKYALPKESIKDAGTMFRYDRVKFPPDGFLYAPISMGAINTPREKDGTVRRVPLIYAFESPDGSGEVLYLPSLSMQSLLLYWGISTADLKPPGQGLPSIEVRARDKISIRSETIQRDIPIDSECRIFLNQRFKHRDISNISFVDASEMGLLAFSDAPSEKELQAIRDVKEKIAGKIALVAEMGTGALDIGNFALEDYIPNGMAHLFAMDNILRQDYIDPLMHQGRAITLFLLAALTTAVFSTGARRFAIWFTVLLIPAYLLLYATLFGAGTILPLILPISMLMTMFTSGYFLQYSEEAAQRQQVRLFFSKMVSSSVLDVLERNPDHATLSGEKREATMFFSDLANFTTISERLPANELSALLNRYLTPMTHIILSYDGYVDKFSGDGIMADWGVPVADPLHAVKACRAAIVQQREAEKLAAEIREELGIEIYVRMGLNSGIVSAGNMGAEEKFQYTVMGDAVNLAARLEPANKDYKTRIIIGQGTYTLAKGKIVARLLDRLVVKGKTEPVTIYELLDAPSDGEEIVAPAWVSHYEAGYNAHAERKWSEARAAFVECIRARGGDGACDVMLARIEHYEVEPPPELWHGEWVRKAKD